jgi:fibronectin-binding autotransporter adhesin
MSAGTSLVGTLDLAGGGATSGLTLANTSVLKFDLQQGNSIAGSGINDLITVGGQLTLDGTLQVIELGGSLTNGMYRLFNYTGALTDNTLTIDAAFLAGHAGSTIDTSFANQVNLQVVPEPATWALLAFSLTTILVLRRRRA